jgi:hypothetical protein
VACMRYVELFATPRARHAAGEAAYLLTSLDAAVQWLAHGAPGCDSN